MTFQFRELRIKDWLVYQDVNIKFPEYTEGKNLVVFNGQNGFGKTSLLHALEFLFNDSYKRDDYLEFWNHQAQQQGSNNFQIELEFLYDGQPGNLVRRVDFESRTNGYQVKPFVELWIAGEPIEDQVEDQIQQLVPKDCLQFVFFDGAEITRYASKQNEDGVREAIELMLGIPAIRNLAYDLSRVIDDLKQEQSQIVRARDTENKLVGEIEDLEDTLANYQSKKDNLQEKRSSLEKTLLELQSEANHLENAKTQQEALKDKIARRATIEEQLDIKEQEIQELLRQAPLYLLEGPIAQILQEVSAKQSTVPRRNEVKGQIEFLDNLLDEIECVCGREFNDDAIQTIKDKLSYLESLITHDEPSDTGLLSRSDEVSLTATLRNLTQNKPDGERLFNQRSHYIKTLEEIDTDIRRIQEELKEFPDVDVQETFQQIGQLEQNLSYIKNSELVSITSNIDRTNAQLEAKQRELNQLASETQRGKGITVTLEETTKLHNAVLELVDELVQRKRHDIEQITSKIFVQITNKPDEYAGVTLRNDYTLEVYRHDSTSVDNTELSAGEKEVLAYSFITALNLSTPNPVPFVMDTPFGHLDSSHKDGLLRSLPLLPVQVLLLATDRDLPLEEKNRLQGRIAEEFNIRRDQSRAISYIVEA